MVRRAVALCNGKYIGIETIYTVSNGCQINIPDKLTDLREKSQRNQLFCPCGCGKNLILVASDKNFRAQHFREKSGTGQHACVMTTESKVSINSKIVLKCWLDDKLTASDIELSVSVDTIEDVKGRSKVTFLSREKKLAIQYWREREYILDDKLDMLTETLSGFDVIYFVDASNRGTDGQYPELLMKIQERQKYCLFLDVVDEDYYKAEVSAVFYEKNVDELWSEVEFARALLSTVKILDNQLFFDGAATENLLVSAKQQFVRTQQAIKEKRDYEKRLREEQNKQLRAERERQRQERKSQWKENEVKLQQQREDEERRRKELGVRRHLENIATQQREAEERQREEDFKQNMRTGFEQQETQVRDAEGNRWVKCEYCEKIAKTDEFVFYGGLGHINLGICRDCSYNNPAVKEDSERRKAFLIRKYSSAICPVCGEKLQECNESYGKFYRCVRYPNCEYRRPTRK